MASTTENGSCSMSTRSLNVPGSLSSAFTTRWWGRPAWRATASHLRPVGKAAPPRPTSPDASTSATTASGPSSWARASARNPPSSR